MSNSAKVLANHTFKQRAERILEVAQSIYRKKTSTDTAGSSVHNEISSHFTDFVRDK
jgi:hypothetical protein